MLFGAAICCVSKAIFGQSIQPPLCLWWCDVSHRSLLSEWAGEGYWRVLSDLSWTACVILSCLMVGQFHHYNLVTKKKKWQIDIFALLGLRERESNVGSAKLFTHSQPAMEVIFSIGWCRSVDVTVSVITKYYIKGILCFSWYMEGFWNHGCCNEVC